MAVPQVSHVDFLHLLFNGSALWSLGTVEALGAAAGYGTAYYLQTSLLLLVLSGAVRAYLERLFRQLSFQKSTSPELCSKTV